MSTLKGMLPWLLLAGLVIVLDQLSKLWILQHIPYQGWITLAPVLNITHVYNNGAAFSFLQNAGGWQRILFSALAVTASAVIIGMLRKIHGQKLQSLALSLILGGAIGNLIDRVIYGHVVDFIQVHWQNAYFPSFNVADSAICVGAALMIWDSFFGCKHATAADDATC